VSWTLVQADGTADERIDLAAVKASLDGGEHFWLDLGNPEAAELEALSDLLQLHPLVRDDLGAFAKRAKADDYPTTPSSSCSGRRTTPTAWSRRTSWSPRSGW
jgi:Mg2+ and Co2+ transporter CorA